MAHKKPQFSSSRPSIEYLSHLGPHPVAAGELSEIGIPGIVFAPVTGPRCPAIVFGHGYLQPVQRYADTLRYLASWGFVAAAPATERGPLPSHAGLALDMARTLDRLCDAKLGGGRVTVDRRRLGLAGHGIGGGAAVLAAQAGAPPVHGTATIFAAPTSPSAAQAARSVQTAGLHLIAAHDDLATADADGEAIARAWAGPAQLRRLKGANHWGLVEGNHWTSRLLGEDGTTSVQRAVRTTMTAFFMLHVAGHTQLADEMAGKVAGTTPVDLKTEVAARA